MSRADANRAAPQVQNQNDQPPVLVINSYSLFSGRREVRIRHRGTLYRLLITRNGKLILNK